MQLNKKSLYEFTLSELETTLIDSGFKKYLATQIFEWIYQKNVVSFSEMKNIKKETLDYLNQNFYFENFTIEEIQEAKDFTIKFLFKLSDNEFIETVLMKFDYGYSVCLSSQIGCNMGCTFCASGLIKKVRDLTISELVYQFVYVNNYVLKKYKEKVSHIVVMGIGEPFDNFNNLLKFLEIVKTQKGLNIGARRITVSTCGLVNKIEQWSKLQNQVNLAISLHAPNDTIRNKLMPINTAFNIKKLLTAIDNYIAMTNRRVTIEYILIEDVNDLPEHAYELIDLLKNKLCYVNLIPYNPVKENIYSRSKKCKKFYDILKSGGLMCTIRLEKGTLIDAACGQLRNKKL